MKPVQRNEILPLGDYEGIRPHFRARVIEEKKARRFALGPHMSGLFENHDTALLQIQEMLRTERITSEPGILHEIETYNELVPGPGEVSVTCFVEISDRTLREETLERLAGLENCFSIEVDGQAFPFTNTREEDAQPHRTTAVHYLKAKLSGEALSKIAARSARVAVVVRHPAYEARADLPPPTLSALAADLRES
jgi:hypothetical protein